MRVLVAGGVFRRSANEQARLQPAPEVVLARALQARGVMVQTEPLEALRAIGFSKSFDLVHVHHLSRGALVAAGSPFAAPFVFTPHGLHVSAAAHRAAERLIEYRMHAGICLSEEELEIRATRSPRIRGKLHVVPNATAPLLDAPVLRTWHAGQAFNVLFVGQLIRLKRVDRLIKSLVQDQHLRLRLVFHNDTLAADLRELAESLGVAARVEFVGALSGDELARAYSEAHLLALPSETEALPSVITEALGTGLPVVASQVGGIPGQVAGAGVILPPDRDIGWSEAMRTIRNRYAHYAQQAVDRGLEMRTSWSTELMVAEHIKIYESVIG